MNAAQGPNGKPSDFGALDFEFTDLADAREALNELPPGVGTAQTLEPGYWTARRRKPEATDRALTGAAIEWMLALPEPLRPKALCERFPRVANALAAAWPDPQARTAAVERLVNDERGKRAGFPYAIRREIEALAEAVRKG